MSDSTMDDQLPDGDGKLGNDEGPADSGAGGGVPGEHDGGRTAAPAVARPMRPAT